MSVDTKGFVLTKKKDYFAITAKIELAIVEHMKQKTGLDTIGLFHRTEGKYTFPVFTVSPRIPLTKIDFVFDGEHRSFALHMDCDNDYAYVRKGKKIILSCGAWGSSVELMTVILKALAVYGEAWICEQDSTEEWRQVNA